MNSVSNKPGGNIWYSDKCIVCHSPNLINFQKKHFSNSLPSNWVAESTLELLEVNECLASYKFCLTCNHFFREPLYRDSLLYSEKGPVIRSKAFKKYTGNDYKSEAVAAVAGDLRKGFKFSSNQLKKQSIIAERIGRRVGLREVTQETIKILDYGAGSGYFLDLFTPIFYKELCLDNVEFYNYDLAVEETPEVNPPTKARFIADPEKIKKIAPFDVISCSDVLEHIADPLEFTRQMSSLLKEGGIIFLEVPLELTGLRKQTGPSAHISFFTRNSLGNLLKNSGFSKISVYSDAFSSYRGAPCSICQGIGIKKSSGNVYRPVLIWLDLGADFIKAYAAGAIRRLFRRLER
jgi:SAM-dependent methyltransferase